MARLRTGPGQEQVARRLLLRLQEEDAALRLEGWAYRLSGRSTAPLTRGSAEISARLVDFCVERDWIEQRGDRLVLSEAGRAWLRRSRDSADPFREQHQQRAVRLKEIAGTRRPVLVNETESPLAWLRSRKDRNGKALLSDAQFEAGERLRADYWFAQLSARVTANWSALAPSGRTRRASASGAAALRDEVIAAKERVNRALEAVGPELAGVLIDICCELKGLEQAERNREWPQRAAKVVLQIALSKLARHYGIESAESANPKRRMRHWGQEDYRPTLAAWRGPGGQ